MPEQDRHAAIISSIRERVMRRANVDADFRHLLINHPKSAIARELGIDIPDGVNVTVLPERPDHVFVVLPVVEADLIDKVLATGLERLAITNGGDTFMAYGGGGAPDSLPQ